MAFVIVGDDDNGGQSPVTDERGNPKIYKTREQAEQSLPGVQELHLRFVPPGLRDKLPPMRVAEVAGDTNKSGHWYFR